MSKTVLRAESATEAYTLLEREVFGLISTYFRLFKTAQRSQDEYLLIRALPGSDPNRFLPTTYRADRDVIDMLAAADIPTAIVYPTVSDSGNAKMYRDNILAAWRRQPATQVGRLSGFCYLPGGPEIVNDKLNMYKDVSVVAIEPPDSGALQDIFGHLLENICNENVAYFEYLLKWLAHMMQKPAVRPKTGIAIIGSQGTGKGVFMDFLRVLLGGDRNCNTTASSTDTKSFNFALANKVLVVFDEATFAGDRSQSDFMKKLVTEPRLRVEQKGIDAFEVDNFARVLITSNNMHSAVPASLADRRWLIMECKAGVPAAKLKALADKIGNNGEVPGAEPNYASWFKHHLMSLDISAFDPVALPMQDTGFDTKLRGLYKDDPITAMWWEWLRDENLTLYRHSSVSIGGGDRQEIDLPLTWRREVLFADFYAVLEELCKASYANVPARNRIKGLLLPYGANTVTRAQHTIYVALPKPADMLAALQKSARFDAPISDAQFEIIAGWSDDEPAAPQALPQQPPPDEPLQPGQMVPLTIQTIDEFFAEVTKP
ncbi:primase-helicase family protein [Variovorax sp. LG9.2]|uniref:primase-helicase family protein n=1 Tax=Variovorax sp. LG9.2 TaxID=3048626 RepID=UPI002B234597|nr:primase-helicase family protein [Variovorax sp. LG9.2]MEB0056721.1 DUF5906 domain-containing protein [Variovorax sp. LG9.2]